MYFKKIIGRKCYLSPINVEDYEKYTQWVNDMEVAGKAYDEIFMDILDTEYTSIYINLSVTLTHILNNKAGNIPALFNERVLVLKGILNKVNRKKAGFIFFINDTFIIANRI